MSIYLWGAPILAGVIAILLPSYKVEPSEWVALFSGLCFLFGWTGFRFGSRENMAWSTSLRLRSIKSVFGWLVLCVGIGTLVFIVSAVLLWVIVVVEKLIVLWLAALCPVLLAVLAWRSNDRRVKVFFVFVVTPLYVVAYSVWGSFSSLFPLLSRAISYLQEGFSVAEAWHAITGLVAAAWRSLDGALFLGQVVSLAGGLVLKSAIERTIVPEVPGVTRTADFSAEGVVDQALSTASHGVTDDLGDGNEDGDALLFILDDMAAALPGEETPDAVARRTQGLDGERDESGLGAQASTFTVRNGTTTPVTDNEDPVAVTAIVRPSEVPDKQQRKSLWRSKRS